MCGRYYIEDDNSAAELWKIVSSLTHAHGAFNLKTGEVFPTDTAPVLANSRARTVAPFAMKWGYALGGGKLIINAKSETAAEKPLFREGMAQRRCLVPASWYFEWARADGQKQKHRIAPAGRRVLYMAGIYRLSGGGAEFTILTRAPAPAIAFIHDRMPVILPENAQSMWLDLSCPPEEALSQACLDIEYQAV